MPLSAFVDSRNVLFFPKSRSVRTFHNIYNIRARARRSNSLLVFVFSSRQQRFNSKMYSDTIRLTFPTTSPTEYNYNRSNTIIRRRAMRCHVVEWDARYTNRNRFPFANLFWKTRSALNRVVTRASVANRNAYEYVALERADGINRFL